MDASGLSTLQVCPRQYLIEGERPAEKLWRPAHLFEECLKLAIVGMSNGWDRGQAIIEATTMFAERAARPGLLTSHHPYTIAQDWIAILKTVLTAFKPYSVDNCGLEIEGPWEVRSMLSIDASLHIWKALPKFTKESMTDFCQSWAVIGDICATGLPMVVHFIETGTARKGHQHTHWCRTFAHPVIRQRFAFQQRDGSPLEGKWKPIWFQDSDRNEPKDWVAMMERDGVKLIHDVRVKAPTPEQRAKFWRDLEIERKRAAGLVLSELPIYRPACNFPTPCQWQYICFD